VAGLAEVVLEKLLEEVEEGALEPLLEDVEKV
jgi:hypothetical protein